MDKDIVEVLQGIKNELGLHPGPKPRRRLTEWLAGIERAIDEIQKMRAPAEYTKEREDGEETQG